MSDKKKETIFYLRTDLDVEHLKAGGSVAHTIGVIEGFRELGFFVSCASSAMVNLLQGLNLKGFRPLRYTKLFAPLGFRLNCLISNFFFAPKSLWFLRKQKIKFVYQRYSLLNFTGVIVAWFKRVPLVLEFNGSEAWIDKHWVPPARFIRIHFLIQWIENLNVWYAKRIIVVSQALKDFLVQEGVCEEKILVNPNGVDTKKFDPAILADDRLKIRKQLGLENKFVFGFIGSFSIWHGIETIAAMIPKVIERHQNAYFLLIGDGPFLPFLKDELKKNGIGKEFVLLTGVVPQAEAKKYLASCDAFLSPTRPNKDGSRFFGSPTKMFEYLSLGKPTIASDLEQLSELLYPALKVDNFSEPVDKVGVLVSPHDVKAFIEAACSLVSMDKKTCQVIGANARRKAMQKYSWHDHTKRIVSFFDKS